MKQLNEWSLGKAKIVTEKLFALITKKTNIKYFIVGIPHRYTNSWGKFQGFYVIGSDRRTYRVNFSVGKTEEIVSIDRFDQGKEFDNLPADTLSLEGYGIGKIFNQIVDYMKGYLTLDSQKLVESVSLKEGVFGDLLRNFLKENPQWIDDFRDGQYDSKELKLSVDKYCKDNGYSGAISLSYVLASIKSLLLKDPTITGNVPQARAAASGIALAVVVPGKQGVTVIDELPPEMQADFAAFEKLISSDDIEKPEEVIEGYRTAIEYMLTHPEDTQAGIIAYGKPGTGKTYHAQDVLQKMGMTQGLHYEICNSKVASGTDGLIALLNMYKDRQLIIFDDCDNILRSSNCVNVLKNVMQDTGRRWVSVKTPIIVPGMDKVESDFDVNAKFIFCTNLQLDNIESALKSRAKFFEFNFTDDEIVEMMKKALDGMFADIPELTSDKKLYVYTFMRGAVQRKLLKEVSFRTLNESLRVYVMCERLRKSFPSEVAKQYKQLNRIASNT